MRRQPGLQQQRLSACLPVFLWPSVATDSAGVCPRVLSVCLAYVDMTARWRATRVPRIPPLFPCFGVSLSGFVGAFVSVY